MSNKNKIKKILDQRNNANAVRLRMINLQKRLQTLVNEHGLIDVALAAGYKQSTLLQYLRVNQPHNIKADSVRQAEEVFRKIKADS